jgi:outer membrane lipoprotein SlyB
MNLMQLLLLQLEHKLGGVGKVPGASIGGFIGAIFGSHEGEKIRDSISK